ncbi:hypothetical protein THAOC_33891, partial [Thalassiosira oceanica]
KSQASDGAEQEMASSVDSAHLILGMHGVSVTCTLVSSPQSLPTTRNDDPER